MIRLGRTGWNSSSDISLLFNVRWLRHEGENGLVYAGDNKKSLIHSSARVTRI
jgi:hypothetical protein